jgi:hypothetical protein
MSQANISLKLQRAIAAFDKAAQEVAFVGSYEPEIRPEIEERHVYTRLRLERLIAEAVAEAARK